jgi:diacylglycerol O-acyltransferase
VTVVAVLSCPNYADTCYLGINVDTGAIPDHDVFSEGLIQGFDEVLALARTGP